MPTKKNLDRSVWGWALYDWANSAYATTVMAGFFPIFFKTIASAGAPVAKSTAALGLANSIGVLIVCLAAPALGAIADAGGYKKKFLAGVTLLGAALTAALAWVPPGGWKAAAAVYTASGFAFAAGLCFYDSLLPAVARGRKIDRVSALGFALGYIGGGLLFAVNVAMLAQPAWFGLASAESAIRASFLSVAVWWILFSIPTFLWVSEEKPTEVLRPWATVRRGLSELGTTLRHVRSMRNLLVFLAAFFLYNDGVGTTMKMAVDYGIAIGFAPFHLVLALLLVQFIGFPSTLFFGRLTDRLSSRQIIFLCIGVYLIAIVFAVRMQRPWEFFLLAALVGSVQGGIQAISRSFYARLIPQNKSAEFFGFYNLMGKMSGLLGPALVGIVSYQSGSNRLGVLMIALLFIAGALILRNVRDVE